MCMLMQNAFEIVSVWVYGCMSERMGSSEDYLHFPKNKNRVCVTFWLLFFPLPLFLQNIFKSENCQSDYLEIRDGYWHQSPLIARFCGKVNSEILTTVSSRMLLTYVSTHRSEGYRGFKAEFDGE